MGRKAVAEISTSVQDGPERAYVAHAVVDSLALASVHEANFAFLALLAESAASRERLDALGIDAPSARRVQGLEHGARRFLAACPYALFDLHFNDAAFWRAFALGRDPAVPAAAHAHAAFARTAVFLAWHLAQSNELAASLVLGMTAEVQRLWRGMPVSMLERAAHGAAPRLMARWGRHSTFWPKLLDSAAPSARERFEAVRLLGLQLIAADGAWPPAGPAGVAPKP